MQDMETAEKDPSPTNGTPMQRFGSPWTLLAAAAIVGVAIVGGFYIHAIVSKPELAGAPEYQSPNTRVSNESPRRSSPSEVIDFKDAPKHIGEHVTVRGRIVRIATPNKTTFINFSEDWRNDPFTAVIFEADAEKFKNIGDYEGKTVLITGVIKEYKGKAEIVLTDPSQIRLE